jgi:hypothetical protein
MTAKNHLLAFSLVLLGLAGVVRAADEDGVHYPLTMARAEAYFNALLNLGKAAQKDSKLSDTIDKISDASTPTTTIIAAYESSPSAKQAFKAAGLTTQQFVYIGNALLSCAFGTAYEQQTHGKLDKVYDAANVAFCKAHEKDIKAMNDNVQKGIPAGGAR